MRGKLHQAISRRNFLKGSGTAAVAAAALPAGMVRSLPAEAAVPDTAFPHGLASGDPLHDRVMIWTRLSPEWVQANAGQSGGSAETAPTKPKPRCKGCKVERKQTGNPRARCKGCKVQTAKPGSDTVVTSAELLLEIIGPLAKETFDVLQIPTPEVHSQFEQNNPRRIPLAVGPASDFTVKTDVTELDPDSYYFYRFSFGTESSPIARTKTLPLPNATYSATPSSSAENPEMGPVKIALVSCSSIPHGYFNAYGALAGKGTTNPDFDDVDVVLCLGDYIYEYAETCYGTNPVTRTSEPSNEMFTLSHYRQRHRQYKADADLQALHRKFPMINVWDDHEATDNSWPNGALNHTGPSTADGGSVCNNAKEPGEALGGPNEGVWNYPSGTGEEKYYPASITGEKPGRFDFARQAYFEYLPVRPITTDVDPDADPNDHYRLHRVFQFGTLADLIMLDTRLRREGPGCDDTVIQDGSGTNPAEGAEICSMTDNVTNARQDRYLLGKDQFAWLGEKLDESTATWQVLGQQIMVGQLRVLPNDIPVADGVPLSGLGGVPLVGGQLQGLVESEGLIYITDIWDGWQASRDRLYREIENVNLGGIEGGLVHAGTADERTTTRSETGNVVILTGDIHTSWANDIHPDPLGEDYAAGANKTASYAVEYVCPSITSAGLPDLVPVQNLIRTVNPHVQYIDLGLHGFMTVELTADTVTGTWHNLPSDQADNTEGISKQGRYELDGNPIPFTSTAGNHYLNETCLPDADCPATRA